MENTFAAAAEPFLFDEEIPSQDVSQDLTSFDLLDLELDGQKTPIPSNNINNFNQNQDWMMSFESPQKLQPSLLDCLEVTTPRSCLKYSEKDMDQVKKDLSLAHNLEIDLARVEIADLEKVVNERDVEMERMRGVLVEWETAVRDMLAEREREKTKALQEREELNDKILAFKKEISELRDKEQDLMGKWKQLRLDHTDLMEINSKQSTEIQALHQKLSKSQTQFEALKNHAQEKLEEANQEISRVHATFENENVGLKSKCSRLETQNKNLTKALEGKTTENEELMKICDELEKQLSG